MRAFFLWMKGRSFEKLKQIFSAVVLACAVVFLIIASLLSTCYLFEWNGPTSPCFATFGFVLVHGGFLSAASRVLRLRPGCSVRIIVTPHSQGILLRGWAVCACCSRMGMTEREDKMEL